MPDAVVYLKIVNGQPPINATLEIMQLQARNALLEKKTSQAITASHLALSAAKPSELRQNVQRSLDYLYETHTFKTNHPKKQERKF